MLSLRSGGAVLELLPELGGAVGRFAVDGLEVLRRSPPGVGSVLDTASFPLVPFANRIAFGTFRFADETIRLPRNFGDHPHALHGQGWQNPWRVRAQFDDSAVLMFDHPAGDWPWRYTARQSFVLSPRALRMTLTLTNNDTRPMPASLGFHPYFPRLPGSHVRADVAGVWLSDAAGIPTATAEPAHFLDLANGTPLADAPFVDHCHFGWTGRAQIAQPDQHRTVHISAGSGLSFLHVFVPPGAPFFCVEPVSAMPDAFNRGDSPIATGLSVLAPGASRDGAVEIRVVNDD